MSTPNETLFCLLESESCDWDNCRETRCPQADDPAGSGFFVTGVGHRILTAHPSKLCIDAHGVRADLLSGTFRRFSAPPGAAGTPPGFEAPDGFNHFILSPYVRADPDDLSHWDYWPPGDPGVPSGVAPTCGFIVEGGGYAERAWLYCTPRGGYPTVDPIPVVVYRHHSGRPMYIHTSQVHSGGDTVCLETWWNHLLSNVNPYGGGFGLYGLAGMFDFVGVDLSGANFNAGPFDASTEIAAIRNAALAKVQELTGDNMDRIEHYGDAGGYLASLQDWWEREWPNPAPAHANQWPFVRTLICRLRESGKTFEVDLVMRSCRMWTSLQILAVTPHGDPAVGEVRPSIVFGVDFELDVRLDLGANWPGFDPPAKITRTWLDPDDPDYIEEVSTTWTQDGTSGQSVEPGLRNGGATRWSLNGERMTFVGGDGKTYFPPLKFGWRAELGQDTDPAWPDWQVATDTYVNARHCCGLICSMRPLIVPAMKTRRVGVDAPVLFGGSVALTMGAHYSAEMLEGVCGCPG